MAPQHFFYRAGFGVAPGTNTSLAVRETLAQSAMNKPIAVVEPVDAEGLRLRGMSPDERKQMLQKSRKTVLQLNQAWLAQMANDATCLREKMTLFWHDHFACRTLFAPLAQKQNNTLRHHALGSFRQLLQAIAKDPAMLQFLNNQQNRKDSPNENFAREVMELFTLGRGHYTEEDVKEAARAFTGWAFNPMTTDFLFRTRQHDDGVKTFRGQRGRWGGEDIVDMLLEDKQTARFVVGKIWKSFVSDQPPEPEIAEALAADFFRWDYDIARLMESLYTSSWFYENRFRASRIKTPVELLAGILVQTGGRFQEEVAPLFIQRALGQVLFYPPNVGGWPQGPEWIDSSSLTFRLSLPSLLFSERETDFQAKDDGDANNLTNGFRGKNLALAVDWKKWADVFTKQSTAKTLEAISAVLLARPLFASQTARALRFVETARTDEEVVRQSYLALMSLPEYQLC